MSTWDARRAMTVAMVANALSALDISVANVAFPAIRHSFPTSSPSSLSWVLTSYPIVFAGLLVATGRQADHTGRRKVFGTGLLLFASGLSASAVAPTLPLLVGGRVLQSVGAACMMPAALGIVLAGVRPEGRSAAVGAMAGAGAAAAAIGPAFGSVIVEAAGWRAIFLVQIPVALTAFGASRRWVAESKSTDARAPDVIGALLVTATVTAIAFAVVQGGVWGWRAASILAAFGIAAALTPVALWRSAHHPAPVIDLRLFSDRVFSAATVGIMIFGAGFLAVFFALVQFLTEVWRYSILEAGLAFSVLALVISVTTPSAGRLAGRIGHRRLIVPGTIAFTAGAMVLWFGARLSPSYLSVWLPASLLLGFGTALSMPMLNAAAMSRVAPNQFSIAAAIVQSARLVGGAIGAALLFAFVGTARGSQALGAFDRVWIFVATMGLATCAVALTWLPRPARDRVRSKA